MKIVLNKKGKYLLEATNATGLKLNIDNTADHGGGNGFSPMETMLTALPACSAMDVISILEKKRKTITNLEIEVQAERSEEHPKVFTSAKIIYKLQSPDARLEDLERSVELSKEKYCSVSAMFEAAGIKLEYVCFLN